MMITLEQAFLRKYPSYPNILRMFEEANGCGATWENLTKVNLQTFVEYMGERVAQSSARQYAAKLKAVLNLYSDEVTLPRDCSKILSIRNEKSVSIWLTEDELRKLHDYRPRTWNERIVRAQFLIGAYTGCRKSDFSRITRANIHDGYLSYVSQKTKTCATVPIKPIIYTLLEDDVNTELTEPTFNANIRNICRDSGIVDEVKVFKAGKETSGRKWEFVTSHTARKSFCTNLYLRGADLYSISKMAGHASVSMTENYLCCGLREQSEKVMEYFK